LPAVQGIGWWLEEANMAQVSLNLIDHDVTPIHLAYEEVCKDAAALSLPVVGSEIVGLVPLKALMQVCSPRLILQSVGEITTKKLAKRLSAYPCPSKSSRILNEALILLCRDVRESQ
jgi:glutamate formiminotransferase